MIERKLVAQKLKEFQVEEYVKETIKRAGHSHTQLKKTPLGAKLVIHTSRPGLIVGRKGQNIKTLTEDMKHKFELENPQIEVNEVENPSLNAQIMAEKIAGALERYGTARFKGVGHKVMSEIMGAGALGVEIIISGKIPGARAKSWRFYQGYIKKCGEEAIEKIRAAKVPALLKPGIVGIQVRIMGADIELPDEVEIIQESKEKTEEKPVKEETKKTKKTKEPRKKKKTEEKGETEK